MLNASETSCSRLSAAGVSAVRQDNDAVVSKQHCMCIIDPLDKTSPISGCHVDGG